MNSFEIKRIKYCRNGIFVFVICMLFALPTMFIGSTSVYTWISVIMLLIGIILMIISIFFINYGRYNLSVYFMTFCLPVLFFIIFASSAFNVFEIAKCILGMAMGLIFINLASEDKKHLVIYFILANIFVFLFVIESTLRGSFTSAYDKLLSQISGNDIQGVKNELEMLVANSISLTIRETLQNLVFFIVSFSFLFFSIKISETKLSVIKEESAKNKRLLDNIEGVINSSKDTISIGSQLILATDDASRAITAIEGNLNDIFNSIGNLKKEAENSNSSNNLVVDSTQNVKNLIEEQSSNISQSSVAIEEIIRSIKNITDVMRNKRGMVSNLVTISNKGKESMSQAIEYIDNVYVMSENISSLARLIQDVADKTNILALNAAIEASHAGTYGKGFSVVADEIRRLAAEVGNNSNEITEVLKKNNSVIEESKAISETANTQFEDIYIKIQEVDQAIAEVDSAMSEMAIVSKDVLTGVTAMVKVSDEVNNSSDEMKSHVSDSSVGIMNIVQYVSSVKNSIDMIISEFSHITENVKVIHGIGNKNVESIQLLDTQLKDIKK